MIALELRPLDFTLCQCLALFEALRRLGFDAEEIFFAAHADAVGTRVGMAVNVADKEPALFPLALVRESETAVRQDWTAHAAWWNETVDTERAKVWGERRFSDGKLVIELMRYGLYPRREKKA